MNNQLLVILFTLLSISGCNLSFFVKTDKVIRTDYGFTIYSVMPGEKFFVAVKDSSYLRNVENIFDSEKLSYGFQAVVPLSNEFELLEYSTTYIDGQFSDTLAGIIEEIQVIPSVAYYVIDKSLGNAVNNNSTKMIYYVGEKEIKFKIKRERMTTYSIRPFAPF